MAFGLQDSMDFGGTAENYDSNGSDGIFYALENIGVNFASGAASVGVSALAKSAGVAAPYAGYPGSSLALSPSLLARPTTALGTGSNTIILIGALLIGGLLFVALRRKG